MEEKEERHSGRIPIDADRKLTPAEEQTLKNLFYKPRTGFMNTYKLSKKARFYPSLSQVNTAQIKQWYWDQPVNQVFRETKKPKVFDSIISSGPGRNLQMDFLIQPNEYHGFSCILCIIDVYSRKAWAYPCTSRKGETYTRLFKELVEEELGGVWPYHLNCDREFDYGPFVDMLREHNVKVHYSKVGESNKNAIVERFIRTLRHMLAKATWAMDKPNWPAFIPELIQSYNEAYHRTIRARPDLVFAREKPSGQIIKVRPPEFFPGDKVRIVLMKGDFEKGSQREKLSDEIYILVKKKKGTSWWILRDEDGVVHKNEPVKEKELRKVGEVFQTTKSKLEEEEKEKEKEREEAEEQPKQALPPELEEERKKQVQESGEPEKSEDFQQADRVRDEKEQEEDSQDKGSDIELALHAQPRGVDEEGRLIPRKRKAGRNISYRPTKTPRVAAQRKLTKTKRVAQKVNKELGDYLKTDKPGKWVATREKRERRAPQRYNPQ